MIIEVEIPDDLLSELKELSEEGGSALGARRHEVALYIGSSVLREAGL